MSSSPRSISRTELGARAAPAPEGSTTNGLTSRSRVPAFRIDDDSTPETGVVLVLHGDLDLHVAPELQDRLTAEIEEGAKLIVLDLSAVTFIDSMALGVLLGAVKRLRPSGGRLRLVVPNPELRRIFEISLLDQVFTLDSTRDEAFGSQIDPSLL
jgi:anti-sigma B factor antagonist